jgi:hypothetical protein
MHTRGKNFARNLPEFGKDFLTARTYCRPIEGAPAWEAVESRQIAIPIPALINPAAWGPGLL